MLISIAAGYTLSSVAYNKLSQTTKKTQQLRDLLRIFLDVEERLIIDHLLQEEEADQAAISRLEDMTRVKAHRTLKRMQEKDLVEIRKHGKINKVRLADDIKELLY